MTDALSRQYLDKLHVYLVGLERSPGTISKYTGEAARFLASVPEPELKEGAALRERIYTWKEELKKKGYKPLTINCKIAAVNALFGAIGIEGMYMKPVRIQKTSFRDESRELTRQEYLTLLGTAERTGRIRTGLVMETICSTGIRVSELRYITLEAARQGYTVISLKGKIRKILLPQKLCVKLLSYAGKRKIKKGMIFRTRDCAPLSRKTIWEEMKAVARVGGVEESKVYPHNLRHLFARSFYDSSKDIVKLADVLGHSNISTTRTYLVTTGEEHRRLLDGLGLTV